MQGFIEQLRKVGYLELVGCEEGINVLYVLEYGMPYVVTIVDCEIIPKLDQQFLKSVEARVMEAFNQAGYANVSKLNIFFTSRVDQIKYLTAHDYSKWIVDKTTRMLIVYENQPQEFLDLRPGLERYLYGNVVDSSLRVKKKSFFTVTNFLIAVNVIIYIITACRGNVYDAEYIRKCGGMYARDCFENGEFYRLFAAMFLHFGIAHLIGNMICLGIIGNLLERCISKFKFLLIYIGGGLVSSLLSGVYNYFLMPNVVAAGASGAIFAVIGALVSEALFDKSKRYFLKPVNIILLTAYILFNGFKSRGVDNIAHMAGLIAGLVLGFFIAKMAETKGKM